MKLAWDDEWLPPKERRAEIEAAVRADIKRNLADLDKPEDLILHHIFLGEKPTDPLVFVYGEIDSDAFHCKYDPAPKWEPLTEGAQR